MYMFKGHHSYQSTKGLHQIKTMTATVVIASYGYNKLKADQIYRDRKAAFDLSEQMGIHFPWGKKRCSWSNSLTA